MHVLQLTFKILTLVGCWRPQSCSSLYLRIIYDAYTVFMIILLYTFLISQFLDIVWNVDNAEDFTENLYAMMASVVSCSKMLSLLVNRKNINMLINVLIEKPYRPLEMDEMRIRYKFDRLIYINTLYYTILVETTCACITVTSLFTVFSKRNLTYRAWLPYDYYSSSIIFCLTYAHQLISLTAGSLVNVGCDSLICGLLVQICCQIEILECRLSKVSNNDDILRNCVRHHNSILQTNTLWYTILVEATCTCVVLTSLFTDFRKGNLTYREWTPYNNTSEVIFCIVYTRQLISTIFGSMVNVACDSLICGLLLHVCCQLEILEYRLKKIFLGQNNLRECVCQHDCIFKFALMVNEKFKMIIAIQFIVSTLVVCSNLYQLAKIKLTAQCFPLILYTCSMLTQILIYCWYGNEVKLKSVQLTTNIFGMGWLTMRQSRKQNLLIIMNRSLIPIEFSSAYILTMNLNSFVSLLKTSYSVYNVLQQILISLCLLRKCASGLCSAGCLLDCQAIPTLHSPRVTGAYRKPESVFMCLLLLTFMLPQLMDIILNVNNADDFTDTFYIMLAMIIAVCKMLSLLLNRKNIEILTDALVDKPFRPLEPDEIEIRQKYNNIIRTNSIIYTIFVEITCGCMNLTSLLTDFRKGDLAYREWIPYEWSDTVYYLTYFRQLMSLTAASIVNVACDIMICGLLLHIYSQIEILKCRVRKALRNRDDLGECVRQHDHIYKNIAMCYVFLIMATCAGHFVVSLLTHFKKRQLILRGWIPYNYSSFVLFCFTYTHQYVGVISAAFINVACDSLIIGLLLHMCCQIMILQYRFKGLINGQNTLGDCVRQHHHIIQFAYATNDRFTKIIAFQFIASTFVVCSNLYQITRTKLIIDFIIFFSLQLVDSIFEIEWIALDHKTKKSLLIIMARAMKPIEFHSAHIFNMNLNSFVAVSIKNLLKTSYSVYNLLAQIQE
ncbi:PREDICTED: uncharacterized protein LOC108780224 [Cyphomyrmex costatus]|uniref:uncharacterized protein LOC108780224 n=1 Tax=Cyphomyrmex costatus TaxID=456900 RepID=UPI0008523F52|nr:PREDICTED: uncharacterized protein LOC108780224 [Cyphomyrmex costatus]